MGPFGYGPSGAKVTVAVTYTTPTSGRTGCAPGGRFAQTVRQARKRVGPPRPTGRARLVECEAELDGEVRVSARVAGPIAWRGSFGTTRRAPGRPRARPGHPGTVAVRPSRWHPAWRWCRRRGRGGSRAPRSSRRRAGGSGAGVSGVIESSDGVGRWRRRRRGLVVGTPERDGRTSLVLSSPPFSGWARWRRRRDRLRCRLDKDPRRAPPGRRSGWQLPRRVRRCGREGRGEAACGAGAGAGAVTLPPA